MARQGPRLNLRAKVVVAGALAAGLTVAVLAASPRAATTETSVTAAAGGEFDRHANLGGLKVQAWTLGIGVVVQPDGTAAGDFQIALTAKVGGRERQLSLEGIATTGSVGTSGVEFSSAGAVTFSGTALLDLGGGRPTTQLPFSVVATESSFQLTLDGTTLRAVHLGAGSISIG